MSRLVFVCLVGLIAAAPCGAGEKVEDGVYPLADGAGPKVRLSGGVEVVLGNRRAYVWGSAAMRSLANANDRFAVELRGVSGDEKAAPATVVLMLGGVCMAFHSRIEEANGPLTLSFTVHGEAAARTVAARLKVEPVLRRHPGHRVELRLTPDKEAYRVGETVTLSIDIRNAGDVPVLFPMGGKQRGPRNNQYRFLAYAAAGHGKAVPDTGDPSHHGGLSTMRPLKPGESAAEAVRLDKWFAFDKPDTYRVTGLYELELASMQERFLRTVIWDELAVGECLVRVVADGK